MEKDIFQTFKEQEVYDVLRKDHWLFNYSWQGLNLPDLERHFKLPRADILRLMREVAKRTPPPDFHTIAKQTGAAVCKSCGMQIIFMQLHEGKSHPCDPKIRMIVSERGTLEKGRESHFQSCPDAENWRKTLEE